jgi:SP family sugar:H+ symporter-like MFS transporter
MTNRRYVTMIAAGAAVGGLLFGFDTSTMNSAIVGIDRTLGLSTAAVGFVAAIALIGCAVGAWFAGPVAARLGRPRVMLVGAILLTIGSTVVALANHIVVIGLFRFIVGLGIGATSAVVPAYIAETSPTSIRGRLGSLWQFGIVIGQLLGLLVGYAIVALAGSEADAVPWGGAAWRWMFATVAMLGASYFVIAGRLPQSPHDLVRHGREREAMALLTKISDAPATDQLAAIREAQGGQTKARRLSDLRGPRLGLRGVVWAGILLAVFQQLVGINVVKTYSNTLWQAVGFSTDWAFVISIITVVVSIVSTVVAIAVIDKIGRRTLLIAGAAIMVVALATLALCFSTAGPAGDDVRLARTPAIAALVAINVYAVGFGVTWGPVMWVMLGELFGSDIRTIAVAVCTAVNWLTNWAVTRTFPLLASAGLGLAYGLYATFAVLAVLFVLKVLPETGGKRLA